MWYFEKVSGVEPYLKSTENSKYIDTAAYKT
jgi:hypothetical protein